MKERPPSVEALQPFFDRPQLGDQFLCVKQSADFDDEFKGRVQCGMGRVWGGRFDVSLLAGLAFCPGVLAYLSAPVSAEMSHKAIEPSWPPEANVLPSGLKAMHRTGTVEL